MPIVSDSPIDSGALGFLLVESIANETQRDHDHAQVDDIAAKAAAVVHHQFEQGQ